jgi:hydrogenase maturation protein HypF
MARIGVMLPYAPVHHLLFHEAAGGRRDVLSEFAIVATSANPGGEPLITDDAQALAKLAGIADLIVTHDREIVVRADDSVMGVIDGAPSFIRRARGFVPEPVDLGSDGPDILACGGHLKATITVTRGREAFVCQHIGDLSDAGTFRFYEESARHLLSLLDVKPEAVACDLHPDYLSTRYAEETGLPLLRIQHHAAHIAAIGAEHKIFGPLLGVALDGHGMGSGGQPWGGELMRLDGAQFSRLSHLAPLALPGGDRAAREPWRMGLAALKAIDHLDEAQAFWGDISEVSMAAKHLRGTKVFPQTTSMGRLFDAAAALLGVCLRQDFEGQAAMELEALVRAPQALDDGFVIRNGVLDFSPLLAFLVTEKPSPEKGADLFHGTLIEGLVSWIGSIAQEGENIALGGGCMMNRILAEGLARELRRRGFVPLLARAFPPNDGGLSLGQAALARAMLI